MQSIFDFLMSKENFSHVFPILIVGAIALVIIIERFRALTSRYPMSNEMGFFNKLRDLIMSDHLAEAIALCDQYPGKPIPQVVREALLRAHQPESMIEDGISLAISSVQQQIQKRTPFLATIANVATLLGLFGTILGLIQSFGAVGNASAQQRSAMLSAGISTSMYATMMGLGVAIPCMLAFAFFTNKINHMNAEVEQAAIRTLDLLKQRFYAADMESTKD